MRMIGIGLMAFFVAWAVYLLSSHNVAQRSLRQISQMAFGPQLIFETQTLNTNMKGENNRVFFKSNAATPIILTGLPAYQSAVFSMPIDARPISGYLQIDITSQVFDDIQSALRVSINNTKRGEILLYSGEAGRSLLVPLLSEELTGERLVVSFSLLGSKEIDSCSSRNGAEAIAEIEATSGLYLNLDRALQSPRDRVLSQGRMIVIKWNNGFSQEKKNSLIGIGASFVRKGEKVLFETNEAIDALSLEELAKLSKTLPSLQREILQWPHHVAKQGANFGLRRFYKTTNWRIKYNPNQFADPRLPNRLELNLALSAMQNQQVWTVSVTLNGSLIHSQTLEPARKNYRTNIELSAGYQSANNVIEVTVDSSENHIGICNNGPILFAQMQQDTALQIGDQRFDEHLFELQNAIEKNPNIYISGSEGITHNQAGLFSRLIGTVLPENAKLKPENATTRAHFLGRNEFTNAKIWQNKAYKQWILFFSDKGEVSVSPIGDIHNEAVRNEISPNAILINVPVSTGAK